MKKVVLSFLCLSLGGCTADFWGLPSRSGSTAHCENPTGESLVLSEVLDVVPEGPEDIGRPGVENTDLGYATCLADAGSKYGQYVLGTKYLFGVDVEQDYETALKLFKRAAKTDTNSTAIYIPGVGDKPGHVQIIRLGPTIPGNVNAGMYAGLMYMEGLGVEANPRKGRRYLKRAAKRNNRLAFELLQGYFPEKYGETSFEEFND